MIYGIGETVLDIVFRDDQPQCAIPGGSTFNSIVSLGRAGVSCAMLAETGDDHVGDLTLAYLRSNGVSDHLMSRSAGMKSHVTLAFLNEKSDADYTFYKDHTGWSLSPLLAAAERVRFTDRDALLFGSFFAVNPLVRPVVSLLLHRAHDAGALIYYDLNYRRPHAEMLEQIRPFLEENIALSTIVRASTDDLHIAQPREWGKAGTIVSSGSGPVTIHTGRKDITLETPQIVPLSTVGAGDNFNAGFLFRYMQLGLKPEPTSWTDEQWTHLARTGQAFGQQVCMSWENSVSKDFIMNL